MAPRRPLRQEAPPSRGSEETLALLALNSPENIKALRATMDAATLRAAGRRPTRTQAVPDPTREAVSVNRILGGIVALSLPQPGAASKPAAGSDKVPLPSPYKLTAENLYRHDQEIPQGERWGAREAPTPETPEVGPRKDEASKDEASEEGDRPASVADPEPDVEHKSYFDHSSNTSTDSDDSVTSEIPYHPQSYDGMRCLATLRRGLSLPADIPAGQVQKWLSANLSVIRHLYFGLVPQPDQLRASEDHHEVRVQAAVAGQGIYENVYVAIRDLAWQSARIRSTIRAIESDRGEMFQKLRKVRQKKDARTRLQRVQDFRKKRSDGPRKSPLR